MELPLIHAPVSTLHLAALLIFSATAVPAQESIELPPFTAEVAVAGQTLHLPVAVAVEPAANTLHIRIQTGLGDLQRNLTPILAAAANRDERCGERLAVRSAALDPDAPAANLSAVVHVERWVCGKAFGTEVKKRLVNGDATLHVRLTPEVVESRSVRLAAEVVSIDAEGELGEMLRSPALGGSLREKIRGSVESALQKALDFHRDLPPPLQDLVAIRDARFVGHEGALALEVRADAAVAPADAAGILDALRKYRRGVE
jgi:hypothetical protein